MAKALGFVSMVPRIVLVVLMVVMLSDMMLGVFFRYVVGQALPWSEEVGTLSLIWITFIGGAIGITRGSHFSIHLFLDSLSPAHQRLVRGLIAILIILFGLVLTPYAVQATASNTTSETPGLGISLAYQYASAAVGGIMIVCYAVRLAVDSFGSREKSSNHVD